MPHRWIAWIALVAVLFAQFSVAAYACPALKAISVDGPMAMATDCDGMAAQTSKSDPDNPTLCLQHCQQGNQHSDHAEIPPILPLSGLSWAAIDWAYDFSALPVIISAQEHKLARASPPPKSILNCCFRI